jgi:P-type conjugative transfer protein TrbJ
MRGPQRIRANGLVALLVATVVIAATAPNRCYALIVFDPTNYAQNLLTAARTLQQINNQLLMLANQFKMLQNQAQHLVKLPYSSLQSLQVSLSQTQNLLNQAQRITYNINQINQTFGRLYPQSSGYPQSNSVTPGELQIMNNAQQRWQNSLSGYRNALQVQAGVVQGLDSTRTQTTALVSASRTAPGMLSAQQAGNEISAQIGQRLADLTALTASMGRALSLEGARTLADGQASTEQFTQFMTSQGYHPQTVQMFH